MIATGVWLAGVLVVFCLALIALALVLGCAGALLSIAWWVVKETTAFIVMAFVHCGQAITRRVKN